MYFPPSTLPSLAHEDQGVWAPADHQRIISKLTIGLGIRYYHQKTIQLEPLPETMLDDAKASPVPDLSLVDNNTDETPIIIEVCKSKGQKDDMKKVVQLIDNDLYGIREGFVYNYKTKQWFRYCFGDGGLPTESSFSELLQLDLNTFL
jgi:Uma2 family endonuclease